MTDISSDNEGRDDRCPACAAVIEPGQPAITHCPRCGQRLWFARQGPGHVVVIGLECAGTRPAHLDEIISQVPKGEQIVDVVLDFREIRSIYSADLAKLISLKRQLDAAGGHLVLQHLHPDLLDIFRITRLDEVFQIAI